MKPVFHVIESRGPRGERQYAAPFDGKLTPACGDRESVAWSARAMFGEGAVEHPSSAARAAAPVAARRAPVASKPAAKAKARTITAAEAMIINDRARAQLAKATSAQERAAQRVAAVGALVLDGAKTRVAVGETITASTREELRALLDHEMRLDRPEVGATHETNCTLVLGASAKSAHQANLVGKAIRSRTNGR